MYLATLYWLLVITRRISYGEKHVHTHTISAVLGHVFYCRCISWAYITGCLTILLLEGSLGARLTDILLIHIVCTRGTFHCKTINEIIVFVDCTHGAKISQYLRCQKNSYVMSRFYSTLYLHAFYLAPNYSSYKSKTSEIFIQQYPFLRMCPTGQV